MTAPKTVSIPLANHGPPRDAVEALLAAASGIRILLLHGPEPESGKTRLLDHCFARLAADVVALRIDMRDASHPADELPGLLRLTLPGTPLPQLAAAEQAHASPLYQVTGNRLIGINKLSLTAAITPEPRRAALTDAFFADVARLPRPLLVAIDSYDDAEEEEKTWIAGTFLPRVALVKQMRVVIAGRQVPAPAGNWRACCGPVQRLEPVTQPAEWKKIIGEMGRRIDSADPDATLAEICRFAGKNTERLMYWIEHQLPRVAMPA